MIDIKIEKFLENGIIELSVNKPGQIDSPIFTCLKKDGSQRVIFNLKKLNESVSYHHFKMDTLETALKLNHHQRDMKKHGQKGSAMKHIAY